MIRTITPLFSIIAALLIFFFFSKPMFQEIEAVQAEAVQFEQAAARASELNAELSNKLNQKRSYPAEALERLDVLVPSSIDVVHILSDLNEMAKTNNMLFGNVTVAEVDDEPGNIQEVQMPSEVTYDDLVTTDLSFSLIGTYEQFKAFLNAVESSLVMLEVITIEFKTGEGNLQQYDLTARVFALPPIE
jgi:Tfp pilus assembly protein PilO